MFGKITNTEHKDLPLAPASNHKQTKITSYVNSDRKPAPELKANANVVGDDRSLSIEEILPDDDDNSGLIVEDRDVVIARSLDNSFLISQFLSDDGYRHANILYNLHSGILLDSIMVEVTNAGTTLTISHAFCPSFHNVQDFAASIIGYPLLREDDDENGTRFRSLHEVARLMKGDNTSIRGEKAINLPFRCQEIPLMQHSIETHYGELMLFLELRATDRTVRDKNISFA